MIITPPKIGVVILNYNSSEDTLGCLEALREAHGGERRVWVVDNASADGSEAAIVPRLREGEAWLETGGNLGYAGGNNAGIREALAWGADYVLILNPDCRVERDFLTPMVIALEAVPKAGMACPLVLGAYRHDGQEGNEYARQQGSQRPRGRLRPVLRIHRQGRPFRHCVTNPATRGFGSDSHAANSRTQKLFPD